MKKLILIILSAVVSYNAAAQDAMPFLCLSRDAAAITSGPAQTMSRSAYSVFSNPTLSVLGENKLDAGASFTSLSSAPSKNFDLGASYKMSDRFAVAIGAGIDLNKPYDIYNNVGNVSGQFTPKDMLLGAGVSYKVLDFLAVGANVKYASMSLTDQVSYNSVAGDVFVTACFSGLAVTAGVSNLGTPVKSASGESFGIPSAAALGVGYASRFGDCGIKAEANAAYYLGKSKTVGGTPDSASKSAMSVDAGAGFDYKDMVFVRAGYHLGMDCVLPSHASLGIGGKFYGIRLDVRYLTASQTIANTIMVGLGYSF